MIEGLLRAEVAKIAGRRGLVISAIAITAAVVALAYALLWITHIVDDETRTSVGGRDGLIVASGGIGFCMVIFGALIGARAGAYDHEKGLVRYWAMTGVPRLALFGVRAPAASLIVFLSALPALVLAILAALVFPLDGGSAMNGGDALLALWQVALAALLWTTLAVAIGALFGSSGPAIAVALVVAFVGNILVSLLALVSDWLGTLPLTNAISVLTRTGGEGPVWAAILVALAWTLLPLAAAAVRVERLEY